MFDTSRSLIIGLLLLLILVFASVSSRAEPPPDSPVIFIPGVEGSSLSNSKGETVWGGSDSQIRSHFSQLEISNTLTPTGVMRSITVYFVLPVSTYRSILDYLKSNLAPGRPFVEFAYDWRQSNFDTACKLVDFISRDARLRDAALKGPGITIVAHSMGGLVGRIFIANREDSSSLNLLPKKCPHKFKIAQFIAVGTPFHGAATSLQLGLNPQSSPTMRALSIDPKEVRRVLYSMPSWYELLPRYQGCCVATTTGSVDGNSVNLFDIDTWSGLRWLPTELDTPEWRRAIAEHLRSASIIEQIVNSDIPENIPVTLMGGSPFETPTSFTVDASGKTSVLWNSTMSGDDTVPQASVRLGKIRAALWPESHLSLLDNPWLQQNLKIQLTYGGSRGAPQSPPATVASRACATCREIKSFRVAGVRPLAPAQGLHPNSVTDIPFELVGQDGARIASLDVRDFAVQIGDASGAPLSSAARVEGKVTQIGPTDPFLLRMTVGPQAQEQTIIVTVVCPSAGLPPIRWSMALSLLQN